MSQFAKSLLKALAGTNKGSVVGALRAVKTFHASPGQQDLVKRLIAAAEDATWPERGYQVPWGSGRTVAARQPNPSSAGRSKEGEPLSAAAVAWLTRLPSDPTQVSAEDAKALFEMTGRVPRHSDDERLLKSIWEPVRRHHEQRAARDEVARLKALPKVVGGYGTPSWDEVTVAVAKTIAATAPAELDEAAAYAYGNAQAASMVAEARSRAGAALDQALAAAQASVAEFEAV